MKFEFRKLSQNNAIIIANEWKYDEPYSFYDITADEEDYAEFINEKLRNVNDYFEAVSEGQLAGFFSLNETDDEIELGLGLEPALCGKGLGKEFLDDILLFIDSEYDCRRIILNVATFNQRAIKVYHSCGFNDLRIYNRNTNGDLYEFLTMYKNL